LLEQAREDLIVSFSTTFYGIQVNAGDVVSVTNTDFGWSAKLFRVMKVNEASLPDGTLGAKLELNEYSADVYDDASITQYAPVANSNLASPAFFSALSAPTVSASYPSATIPSFDVTVTVPTTGRVTFGTLYYTTTPAVSTSWLVLDVANSVDNIPVVNGSTYTFANLTLPAATYYFTFTVGNETATSAKSTNSSAFVWNPVGMVGPSGANGLSAITAYRAQSQSSAAPATPSNTTGATAPSGWSLTAPSVSVGDVLWYTFGQYNSSSGTISGIPAGQTQWGTPTAASVFQDICSDNWNGGFPPSGTFGTTGYYLSKTTPGLFTTTESDLYVLKSIDTKNAIFLPAYRNERVRTKITQASHGFVSGNPIYFSGSTWTLADSSIRANFAQGLAEVVDSNNFYITQLGLVELEEADWDAVKESGTGGLVTGTVYYLSSITPGKITATAPTSDFSQTVLHQLL